MSKPTEIVLKAGDGIEFQDPFHKSFSGGAITIVFSNRTDLPDEAASDKLLSEQAHALRALADMIDEVRGKGTIH